MSGLLSIERRGATALLTLQRPEKRNALSIELRIELAETLAALGTAEDVACVVLTGAGSAFCAGMDTGQFGGDAENRQRLVDSSLAAFSNLGELAKPTIAAVNGPAIAGGFVLALHCDLRLASEAATFGFPELPIGIPPSYAAARAALPAAVARELVLTGRIIDSQEALRRGVVSEVCAAEDLLPRALELAGAIGAMPVSAIAETKRRILLERRECFGPLFADEERVFRRVLLGSDEPEPAA